MRLKIHIEHLFQDLQNRRNVWMLKHLENCPIVIRYIVCILRVFRTIDSQGDCLISTLQPILQAQKQLPLHSKNTIESVSETIPSYYTTLSLVFVKK